MFTSYLVIRKNITRNPNKLVVIAIRKFLINMIIKPHPKKNNNIDILLPANNIATAWTIIIKINNGFFKFFLSEIVKIEKNEKNENLWRYPPAITSSPNGPEFLFPKLLKP